MRNKQKPTEILTLEQLFDRTQTDILGPFLGGFGAITVHGVCISGGVVGNISPYTETNDPEFKDRSGIEIQFPLFALVRSERTFQQTDEPRVERLVKNLRIIWHKKSFLVISDATGMEVTLFPSAKKVREEVEKALSNNHVFT